MLASSLEYFLSLLAIPNFVLKDLNKIFFISLFPQYVAVQGGHVLRSRSL